MGEFCIKHQQVSSSLIHIHTYKNIFKENSSFVTNAKLSPLFAGN